MPSDVVVVPAGSERLGAGAARVVRRVDTDPAGIPDVDLPSIAAAQWIADLLQALRPDLEVRVVRPGVRPLVGALPPQLDKPLRVLTDHTEILAGMTEPHERARTPDDADITLTLSPVSRSHCPSRLPEIATLVPGRDEIIEHGKNGLLAEPDDPRGAARLLDLVAKDRTLLRRLTEGAREIYDAWPTTDDAERELQAAAEEIAIAPPATLEAGPLVPERGGAQAHPAIARPRLRALRERLR